MIESAVSRLSLKLGGGSEFTEEFKLDRNGSCCILTHWTGRNVGATDTVGTSCRSLTGALDTTGKGGNNHFTVTRDG